MFSIDTLHSAHRCRRLSCCPQPSRSAVTSVRRVTSRSPGALVDPSRSLLRDFPRYGLFASANLMLFHAIRGGRHRARSKALAISAALAIRLTPSANDSYLPMGVVHQGRAPRRLRTAAIPQAITGASRRLSFDPSCEGDLPPVHMRGGNSPRLSKKLPCVRYRTPTRLSPYALLCSSRRSSVAVHLSGEGRARDE
jgi:hypothetical protein